MMQRLRDWLIRAMGGVTEHDHEIECHYALMCGRFEVHAQSVLRLTAVHFALQQIRAAMDDGVEVATPNEPTHRTH